MESNHLALSSHLVGNFIRPVKDHGVLLHLPKPLSFSTATQLLPKLFVIRDGLNPCTGRLEPSNHSTSSSHAFDLTQSLVGRAGIPTTHSRFDELPIPDSQTTDDGLNTRELHTLHNYPHSDFVTDESINMRGSGT
jgi:hypothetical protein